MTSSPGASAHVSIASVVASPAAANANAADADTSFLLATASWSPSCRRRGPRRCCHLSSSSSWSFSTSSTSSSALLSSLLSSRATTTSSVGSSASDGKAPLPRGRRRGGPSSSPPRAGPRVRASSRRNPLLPAATACGGRRSPSRVPRVGTSPGVTCGRRVRAYVQVGRRGAKETAAAPLDMTSAAASLLTGAVAIGLSQAARVRGRRGPSSPAVAGPSVARKSAPRPLCDGRGFIVADARAGGRRRGRTGASTTEVARHGSWIAVCGFSTASRPSLTTWHRCSRVRCSSAFSLPARPPLPSSSFFHPPLVLVESRESRSRIERLSERGDSDGERRLAR